MLDKQLFRTIKQLIAKGQLGDALSQLVELTADKELGLQNDVLLLSAKYRSLEKMELDNRITFDNYQRETNQLLRSLITMVDALENDLSIEGPTDTNARLTETYRLSIARTKVLNILLDAKKGLTIKEIYQLSDLKYRKYIIATLDELIEGAVVERYREDGDSLNRLIEEKRELVLRLF